MDGLIQTITDFLLRVFHEPRIVVALVSILPIVEARLAIPIAFSYGLTPLEGWLYAFAGSTLIMPLLLLALIPFIKWLSRTKLFQKAGTYLYEKFEKKSSGIDSPPQSERGQNKQRGELKKMLGVFAFVAVPLPMTGVWTGCAVASVVGLSYPKALVSVAAGNLVASAVVAVLCRFFAKYISTVIFVIGLVAIAVVVTLIVKIILSKPKPAAATPCGDIKE